MTGEHPTSRFNPQARNVADAAFDEARRLRHHHLGSEHILLGLMRDAESLVGRTLASLDVSLDRARELVRREVGEGDAPATGSFAYTNEAQTVWSEGRSCSTTTCVRIHARRLGIASC